MKTYFVTGIDTDIGKSIVCGLLARYLRTTHIKYITAKLVQTGCEEIAEDLSTHRKLEGIALLPEDRQQATCPYIFKFPASPHLAAEMEDREISPEQIKSCIDNLTRQYECVLVEGAGGFMVPLTRQLLTCDFVAEEKYSLIIVSSGRLGSINHTLLTIEAAINRNVEIAGVVYNNYPHEHEAIASDSIKVIKSWMRSKNIDAPVIQSPLVKDLSDLPDIDFSEIFKGVLK